MKTVKLLSLSFFLFLISCGSSISDVKEGMTTDEVEEMLGKPNSTNSNSGSFIRTTGESTSFSKEQWEYNNQTGTIFFENDIVSEIKLK